MTGTSGPVSALAPFSHDRGQMISYWLLRPFRQNDSALIGGGLGHVLASSQWGETFSDGWVSSSAAAKHGDFVSSELQLEQHKPGFVFTAMPEKSVDKPHIATCTAPVNIAVIKYCEYVS